MSRFGAALFERLQDAQFYRDMHAAALAFVPRNARAKWLDAGCGPGLLARLAAARGADVLAFDADADMIARARRLVAMSARSPIFVCARLDDFAVDGAAYDVVSASSLLVVLPEPREALRRLVSLTRPDGVVLVIEASSGMSRRRAFRMAASGRLGRGAFMLALWANARSGRALPDSVFEQPGLRAQRHPLLDGMASAWIVERSA